MNKKYTNTRGVGGRSQYLTLLQSLPLFSYTNIYDRGKSKSEKISSSLSSLVLYCTKVRNLDVHWNLIKLLKCLPICLKAKY